VPEESLTGRDFSYTGDAQTTATPVVAHTVVAASCVHAATEDDLFRKVLISILHLNVFRRKYRRLLKFLHIKIFFFYEKIVKIFLMWYKSTEAVLLCHDISPAHIET
jgi:hypothetical protein